MVSAVTVGLAVVVAAAARGRPRPALRPTRGAVVRPVTRRLHDLHSGHIGDYAAWLTAGVAVLALFTRIP
ncbi:hypothetical protein BJF79_42350 [Actinomadura sp. CNU-125]|nr:hypothetical protein BJF79_42350 [Actinomadura sp. CNU-125]